MAADVCLRPPSRDPSPQGRRSGMIWKGYEGLALSGIMLIVAAVIIAVVKLITR
jgi:hypothetical protein